jgi:hypothetical protein
MVKILLRIRIHHLFLNYFTCILIFFPLISIIINSCNFGEKQMSAERNLHREFIWVRRAYGYTHERIPGDADFFLIYVIHNLCLCKGDYILQWNWAVGPQFCYKTESNCVVLPLTAASQLHYFQYIVYGMSIMLWKSWINLDALQILHWTLCRSKRIMYSVQSQSYPWWKEACCLFCVTSFRLMSH